MAEKMKLPKIKIRVVLNSKIEKYKKLFGLTKWHIIPIFEETKFNAKIMEFRKISKAVVISFNPKKLTNEDRIEKIIIHELIHILLQDSFFEYYNLQKKLIEVLSRTSKEFEVRAEENVCQALDTVILGKKLSEIK